MNVRLKQLRYRAMQYINRLVRVSRLALTRLHAEIQRRWPQVVGWIRVVVIRAIWQMFDAYAFAWQFVQPYSSKVLGQLTMGEQRFVFCLLLSQCIGHLMFAPLFRISLWTVLLCAAHAVIIHRYWMSGPRWCKRQLGLRPARFVDPEKPFAGLDLGN